MNKRRIAAALACVLMAFSLTACGSNPEREIDELNRRFCRSYNNLDMDGVIDCLEPSLADTVNAVLDLSMGLLGAAADIDLDLDAETMYALAEVCFDIMSEEQRDAMQIPELDLELESLEVSDDGTRASGVVTLTLENDSASQSATGEISYVNIDGDWYFANANFQS